MLYEMAYRRERERDKYFKQNLCFDTHNIHYTLLFLHFAYTKRDRAFNTKLRKYAFEINY